MKLLNLFQKILVFLSLLVVIQNIFVILHRNCLMKALVRAKNIGQGTTLRKSVTRCFVDWQSEITTRRCVSKTKAEFDATGMLDMCIPLCAWRLTKPSSHTYGCFSYTYAWVSLYSSTHRAVVGLRLRMSRRWIPTFLFV